MSNPYDRRANAMTKLILLVKYMVKLEARKQMTHYFLKRREFTHTICTYMLMYAHNMHAHWCACSHARKTLEFIGIFSALVI